MRVPMWLVVLWYAILAVGFTVPTIQELSQSTGSVWWIWVVITVLIWYTLLKRIKTAGSEGWTTKTVIIDQRAMRISHTSGYISFIYLMLFLSFSIIGLKSWGFEDPMLLMILGLMSAMFLFAILQLIQLMIR